MDNLNNNNFPRINRNQLISDSNLTMAGSISEDIRNPKDIDYKLYNLNYSNALNGGGANYLESRLHYVNDDVRSAPILGYCLRFDKNNQSAYIQTTIPSTEYSNYDIFIKGEGTVDILYPDHSSTNIAIKQKYSITDTTYFYLSYIAFRNKTTKKIEHLFECEESTGTVLYDAVTGNTATLESVTTISSMRVNYSSKEWIKDEDINLVNRIDFQPEAGGCCYTSTACLSGKPTRSYCMTLEFPEDYDATQTWTQLIGDNIYNKGYYGNNVSVSPDGKMGVRYGDGTTGGMAYDWRANDPYVNEIFGEGDKTSSNKAIIRKGKYKCVFVIYVAEPEQEQTSTAKIYVNGELKHTFIDYAKRINTSSVKWVSNCTLSMFTGGNNRSFLYTYPRNLTNGNTAYSTLVCGCYNVHVFSFEVSDSSPYTIQDYQNDIIPEYDMEGLEFSSGNICIPKYRDLFSTTTTNWGDRSIKNNTMKVPALHIYSKSKCYGTWLDGVGFNLTKGVYIPRKVELS